MPLDPDKKATKKEIKQEAADLKKSVDFAISQLERHSRVNPTTAHTIDTIIEGNLRGVSERLEVLRGKL